MYLYVTHFYQLFMEIFGVYKAVGTDAFLVSHSGTSQDCQESEETTFRFNAPNKNMFLSFGSGTRACVGQEFTVHGISTLLAALLQEYEVSETAMFNSSYCGTTI